MTDSRWSARQKCHLYLQSPLCSNWPRPRICVDRRDGSPVPSAPCRTGSPSSTSYSWWRLAITSHARSINPPRSFSPATEDARVRERPRHPLSNLKRTPDISSLFRPRSSTWRGPRQKEEWSADAMRLPSGGTFPRLERLGEARLTDPQMQHISLSLSRAIRSCLRLYHYRRAYPLDGGSCTYGFFWRVTTLRG